jgi:exosortase
MIDSGRSGQFTVAGACSGMRSLMAFIALGRAMAYFAPRPAWHRVAMAVLVVPVALFCNVVRVIVTGSLQMGGYPSLSSGTPHTILGLLLFGLGFAIYLGVLWVLDNLFSEERADEEGRAGEDGEAQRGRAG